MVLHSLKNGIRFFQDFHSGTKIDNRRQMILIEERILVLKRHMIQITAPQKPARKDMSSILRGKCSEIAGIRKALERNPRTLRKTCCKFRIQDFEKLDAVSDLFVRHLKFIAFFSPGDDHKRAGTELLLPPTFHTFSSHIRPQNVLTWQIIDQHSFCEDKIAVFDSYFSIFHNFFSCLLRSDRVL